MSSASHPKKLLGIFFLVLTVACFACGDTAAKWLNLMISPVQTVALRYVLGGVMVSLLVRPWRNPRRFISKKPLLQLVRGLAALIATGCSYTAMHYISLTQNTSIFFTAPLIISILAGPLLGEWLGARRFIAVLVGFAGVLVITRPGSAGGLPPAALLSLLGASMNAIVALVARKLVGHDESDTTIFYSMMVGAVLVLPAFFFVWTTPQNWLVWGAIGLTAIFGLLGHWFWVLAHKYSPAGVLAPFYYTQLLFAAGLAFLVLGEVPDHWTIAGAAIIVASGLYVLHRERVRHLPPSEEMPV